MHGAKISDAEEKRMRAESSGASDELPPVCEALDILGAKWSILVISGLADGPKRFKQLLRDLAVVRTQSLTDALRHLEKNGIVRREVFPTVPVTVEYSLTEKGDDFRNVLDELDRWVLKWKRQA